MMLVGTSVPTNNIQTNQCQHTVPVPSQDYIYCYMSQNSIANVLWYGRQTMQC